MIPENNQFLHSLDIVHLQAVDIRFYCYSSLAITLAMSW